WRFTWPFVHGTNSAHRSLSVLTATVTATWGDVRAPQRPGHRWVALSEQVVDDILDQIRDGRLNPNDPLPSARKMAGLYGVASMTAQRALRELQHRRITYSVAGKGTFVHPDAFDLLRGGVLREPIDDPDLRHRVATYLADQQAIT